MPTLELERPPKAHAVTRPFPGPSPFSEDDRELFFGRGADVVRLRSLLRTERIVVLHSPSGAGKTSLIQAGLLPLLRRDGFRILPTIRVHLPLPENQPAAGANRFTYSAAFSLESGFDSEGLSASGLHAEHSLVGIQLSTYFAHRSAATADPTRPRLVVFDQFEELFTHSPHDHQAREEFFTDLAEVLRDKNMWALFVLREEHVAALDAYKRLMPAQLAARFHLDFLTPEAARQAIAGPALRAGVTVEAEALDAIVGDLVAGAIHQPEPPPAGFTGALPAALREAAIIDPLHLQLVCVKLWNQRPAGATVIGRKLVDRMNVDSRRDASGLTAVDSALLDHYNRRVRRICAGHPGLERRVRGWIDDSLIQNGKCRRQAMAAEERTFRHAQQRLEDEHLLRANVRFGTTWYEIAHDRMVVPMRRSNDAWYEANLDRFAALARRWQVVGYPQEFPVLTRRELARLGYGKHRQAGKSDAELPTHERRYLEHCQARAWRRWGLVSAAWTMLMTILLAAVLAAMVYKLDAVMAETAREKEQLTRLQETNADILRQRDVSHVRRLMGRAKAQRSRYGNHDVALLLLQRAIRENAALAEEAQRSKDDADLLEQTRRSNFELEAEILAVLGTAPFSQTLPAVASLDELAATLAARGDTRFGSFGTDDESPASWSGIAWAAPHQHDLEILAPEFLFWPGSAGGGSEEWPALQSDEGARPSHLWLRHPSDMSERYELVADARSLWREELLRELGLVGERSGSEAIISAHLSSDRAWLVTGGDAGTVTLWNLEEASFARRMPGEPRRPASPEAVFSWPDRSVAGGQGDADGPRQRVVRAPRTVLLGARGAISEVLVSTGGRHVAAIQAQGGSRLWDLEPSSPTRLATSWDAERAVDGLFFDAEGRLSTLDRRGFLQAWQVGCSGPPAAQQPAPRPCLTPEEATSDADAANGEATLARSVLAADALLVLDASDGPRIVYPTPREPSLPLSDGTGRRPGRLLSVARRPDLTLTVYDLATGDDAGRLWLWDLAWSGQRIEVGKPALVLDLGGPITGLSFHPRGRWLAVATQGGGLRLVDMEGRSCVAPAPAEAEALPCLAKPTPSTPRSVAAVAFNPGGDLLAAAGETLSWRRFTSSEDPPLGDEHLVSDAVGPIRAIAFVPGEENVLAATEGRSILLRSLDEKEELEPIELRGAGTDLSSLAIHRDGAWLAAGDGTARFLLWDLNPARHICRLVLRDLTQEEWAAHVGNDHEQEPICPDRGA